MDENELFGMGRDAKIEVNKWQPGGNFDIFDASHSGYERLKGPVTHRRTVVFDKKQRCFLIKDAMSGSGRHLFELNFHFAPGRARVEPDGSLVAVAECGNAKLALIPLETEGLSASIFESAVSPGYGVKIPAPAVKYSKTGIAPASFATLIVIADKGQSIDAEQARAGAKALLGKIV
jgi:hypothetical protein